MLLEAPYSHGLLAASIWALVLACVTWLLARGKQKFAKRTPVLLFMVVISHYWLDALVHVPDLPIFGQDSPHIGLGLWNHIGLALTLEACILLLGMGLYFRAYRISRARTVAIVVSMLFFSWMMIGGLLMSSAPPDLTVSAVFWCTIPLCSHLATGWIATAC